MNGKKTGAMRLKIIQTISNIGNQIAQNEKSKFESLSQYSLRLRSGFIEQPLSGDLFFRRTLHDTPNAHNASIVRVELLALVRIRLHRLHHHAVLL